MTSSVASAGFRTARAIIWDVGGTLLDWAMKYPEWLRQAFADTGLEQPPLSPEALKQLTRQAAQREQGWRTAEDEAKGWITFAAQLLGQEETAPASVRLGHRFAHYFDLYTPVRGIRELLEGLRVRGIPQVVVSEWAPSLRPLLHYHRLEHYFEAVVCSAEEGVLKPDPALIRRALEHLRRPAAHVVYVGDNPEKDIVPARALGLLTIHFNPRRSYPSADAWDAQGLHQLLQELLDPGT